MPQKAKKTFNFETSLKELDTIVTKMEQGDLDLEKSLQQFEQGVAIIRECQKALQKAEQKVQILVEKNQKLALEEFDLDEDEEYEDDDE